MAEASRESAAGARHAERRQQPDRRRLAKVMFYGHLWVGVIVTALLLLVALTGVLLNHKRGLGLMPDPAFTASGAFTAALPLPRLVQLAEAAAGPAVAGAGVDRMDVRPGDGLVKVRFHDRAVTEVTLDVVSGRVIDVGERNDVFLEQLHSGEIFGKRWVLLSDAAAIGLLITLITGLWLWLYPKRRA